MGLGDDIDADKAARIARGFAQPLRLRKSTVPASTTTLVFAKRVTPLERRRTLRRFPD
jgi:hypothetical protein